MNSKFCNSQYISFKPLSFLITLLVLSNLLLLVLSMRSPTIPSGLASVFKPKGWSSSAVVLKVRWILSQGYKNETNIQKVKIKVGHGGTLDPLAEGVLVLGIGHGTKLMDQYLGGSKKYLAVAKLGTQTDTLDSTGNVTETMDCNHITLNMLKQKLGIFRGEIQQMPPMYSALKKDGKKLYELAREGIEVERKSRLVSVYDLDLVDQHYNSQTNKLDIPIHLPHFGLSVCSSGGFYVRSLISDLARECGGCAHMTDLLRVKHGEFGLSDCLYEPDWTYQSICKHVITCSEKVGINSNELPSAVPTIAS